MDYVDILLFVQILLACQQTTQRWVIIIKFTSCWLSNVYNYNLYIVFYIVIIKIYVPW